MSFADTLSASRVLPVVTPRGVDVTVRTAEALLAGGMRAVEITLRTPDALDSLRAVKQRLPELVVAAGTVRDAASVDAAVDAGADFCVSPGISGAMLDACAARGVPFLPGVATASEVLLGTSAGLSLFKLFPAVAVGGMELLRSLRGPFPEVRFCPTGGLGPDNYRDFLALPNVICCGGSWMVAADLIDNERWDRVEALAREALAV
ncbi:MAG: keto-deoxy-phosphogluconate aldolase [Halioglobus sp.]|nr:keto-deoxy-phosphogluconate aldolase [Halioglobus sp.]